MTRNHFPSHYAENISETNLPAELIPQVSYRHLDAPFFNRVLLCIYKKIIYEMVVRGNFNRDKLVYLIHYLLVYTHQYMLCFISRIGIHYTLNTCHNSNP